jgi:hypothetical protein
MTRLAREIAIHIVADQGTDELLRRRSDPFSFQAFGCILGFDWHSSGVTTTATGALKEGIRNIEHDLGVTAGRNSDPHSQHWLDGPRLRTVLGGKGATSRKTPNEILDRCERLAVDPGPLLYASRTWQPRSIVPHCRMGTSSITTRSFSPAAAPGASFSGG